MRPPARVLALKPCLRLRTILLGLYVGLAIIYLCLQQNRGHSTISAGKVNRLWRKCRGKSVAHSGFVETVNEFLTNNWENSAWVLVLRSMRNEVVCKKVVGKKNKALKNPNNSNNSFSEILKFLQFLNKKWRDKSIKFDAILGIAVILVSLFAVGKMIYLTMGVNINGRRILSKISVLKNGLLYQETFDKIASKLVVYDAKVKDAPLEFVRLGRDNDCGYVVPVAALELSDALMGYGIGDDISFERDFSQRFNKPSFGFDCGVRNIETGDSRCLFFSECIGTSKYLFSDQVSSGHISSFSDQLQRLGLSDKKVFIKMDIEGAEFDVMNDILKYSQNITGMVLELHIPYGSPEQALRTLMSLDRHFVLVHLHCTNLSLDYFKTKYAKNCVPSLLELTYINKNLLSSYKISKNQKHPQPIDQPSCPSLPDCEFEILPID